MTSAGRPLEGLIVVDLSQFLAGPYASLRLQDLGARVIKIERPDGGDLTRQLYLSDTVVDGDSTIFHAINRGKESFALNLKKQSDLAALRRLICKSDVLIQNFRPGVIERLGLGFEAVREFAPQVVYGSISGYGAEGPWAHYPGQDLLAQARSGVMWLNGSADDGPVPFGLSIADMFAGANLAHGILAALVRRGIDGKGCLVETSLIESMIDLQFEVLATHLNDGERPPQRSTFRSAHVGLAAPYGVYPTADGYLAIAMTPIGELAELLEIEELKPFADASETWFSQRDPIKRVIAAKLSEKPTAHWLSILEPHDIWCAEVLEWKDLLGSPAFEALDMVQRVASEDSRCLDLIRSPLRMDDMRASTYRAGPKVGEHNESIQREFGILPKQHEVVSEENDVNRRAEIR